MQKSYRPIHARDLVVLSIQKNLPHVTTEYGITMTGFRIEREWVVKKWNQCAEINYSLWILLKEIVELIC